MRNLKQNCLELCTPVSSKRSLINQEKNNPLPEYVLFLEPNWILRDAIMALYEVHGRYSNFVKFLLFLLKYRNPKNGSKVFPSVASLQRDLKLSRRTIQGYIRRAEDLGYIYIEDCVKIGPDGKPRYMSSRYYFTRLIFDPADEFLQREIEDRLPRKSRQAYLSKSGLSPKCLPPTDVSHKPINTPPRADICAITPQVPDSSQHHCPVEKMNDVNLNPALPQRPVAIVEERAALGAIRRIESKRIIAKYNKTFPKASQKQRETFIDTYVKGAQTIEEMLKAIETLSSAPELKVTTRSPMRLFKMKEVLPDWRKVVNRATSILRRDNDGGGMERAAADSQISWFYFKGVREKDRERVPEIMMNNVAMLSTRVYE